MAHSSETKKWSCLNSKEDLIDNFIDCVDQEVIELVIETRNNNLLLAFRDLEEIAKTSNSNPDLHLSFTEKKTKIDDTTGSDIFNIIDWERLSKNETPTNRVLYLVSRGYKVMVLMRGCPGCGKSYKAANILGQCYENAKVNDFIFSADNYFINKHTNRYCFDRNKLSVAHQWTMENVQKAVQNEITPIFIDNTNTLAWEMEPYVKLSVNNGYWIEIIEPNTEWAWNAEELAKKNSHDVSYSSIILMLKRYDHNINIENLLRRFKLKYSKNNQPPQLSKNFKKYQLCKNLTDANKVGIKPPIKLNELKELHVSQKQNNNKNQFKSCNNYKEDELCVKIIQEKEELNFDDKCENLFYDLSDDDNQSISSTEEASNYVNKSVNTDENDFLFIEFLNEIPEEEYRDYVSIGTNRDINEGNQNILIMPCDKFDKGTSTHDLLENVYKLNLNELHAQFPENICSIISELFDECNGNIEWIIDVLNESGYDISKQQLYALIQLEENNTIENIPIQNIKQNLILNNVQYSQNNTTIISENVLSRTITSNENGLIEKTDSKKKKHKKKKILMTQKSKNPK